MKLLKSRLEEILAVHNKSDWETVERDYVQSWILAAISLHPELSHALAFKGGTAIKKIWHCFRYSEDLDYTEITRSTNDILFQHLTECLETAKKLLQPYGQFALSLRPYREKSPHPFDQAAFIIKVQMPWHRRSLTSIKLEVSREEPLILEPIKKPLIHEYGEDLSQYQILSYSLEEIVTEKFRAILQNQEKLKEKTWIRSRVRDFYDLWKIFGEYKNSLNLPLIREAFSKKCAQKKVVFNAPEQFFEEKYLEYIKKDWQIFLSRLTDSLPPFEEVIINIRRHANEIF